MSQSAEARAAQIMQRIQVSRVRTGPWHWLSYNFDPATPGFHAVGVPTVLALAVVDQRMPGYADEQVRRLEGMGGRDRDKGDYRQILAWYAELLVLQQAVLHPWPAAATFDMEPVAGAGKANPEMVIELEGVGRVGLEVKAPDLLRYADERGSTPYQLNARGADVAAFGDDLTLPRDNPVKDFLISADKKFAGFREGDEHFRSVLVIVWDDYVNEPLTALLAPDSGLFTSRSFHHVDGTAVTYPNVDAVILVRHQHQFVRGLANEPPVDSRRDLLDYGRPGEFPFPALVLNPAGRGVPEEFLTAFHAVPVEDLPGAEYAVGELVLWTREDRNHAEPVDLADKS